jgi:hypothetical protein
MRNQYKILQEAYKGILKEDVAPERLGEILHTLAQNYETPDKVVIQTHYGDEVLPVKEVWRDKNTLYISVDVPQSL